MARKKRILHITPHLGAGVGTVLLNYISNAKNSELFTHSIICLDYANQYASKVAKNNGFSIFSNMSKRKSKVLDLIANSDIVLIHWWNHPLLYDFLVREQLPESRVIVWSHIKGSPPPNNFTDKILKYPDLFVFTTPLSYKIKEVQNLSIERKKYLRDIWSTGGVERLNHIKLKKHNGFNVGYIGNVDYAKMHPKFLDICDKINIPNIKFIVVGGPNGEQMRQETLRRGTDKKFNFTGFVSEEEKWNYLSTFDVFGYPLAPHHYGTCDQVLQESMAVGVVPVVLSNPMEKYMVKNGITGIVAKNEKDYIQAVYKLYKNKKLKNLLSKNAKKYAFENFSLEKMANEWSKVFNEVLNFPKTVKKWDINKKNIKPVDVFLESLGRYGKDFAAYYNAKNNEDRKVAIKKIKKLSESANWRSKSKSTVHQYRSFFPKDEYLSLWSNLMN